MPLRYIRRSVTAKSVLSAAVATTSVSRDLSSLLAFPPAKAAAGILFLIFKTIQDLETNKLECYRLANRCMSLLTDMKDAMEGRWESASDALLRNFTKFEETLKGILDGLTSNAEAKWTNRLLRKSSIETDLIRYNMELDDAARSFQISTLIHIHHAVGDPHPRAGRAQPKPLPSIPRERSANVTGDPSPSHTSGTRYADTVTESSDFIVESPTTSRSESFTHIEASTSRSTTSSTDANFVLVDEPSPMSPPAEPEEVKPLLSKDEAEYLEELAGLEDHGFRTYHPSDIFHTSSRSRISSGWWKWAREVEVDGRKALMLSYEDMEGERIKSARRWLRDVKTLQNVYHPNLPQIIGYSGTGAPTPFILLANVQTRLPQALLLASLRNTSLLDCIKLLIRLYKETFDAATYLQRQLSLSESKTQDYVEHASFRVSATSTVVMGLPPPEANVDKIQSYRNFGLAWSVRDIWLKVLPNSGILNRLFDLTDELPAHKQIKINHLTLLARALLPQNDSPQVARERLDSLVQIIERGSDEAADENADEDEFDLIDYYSDGAGEDSVTLSKLRSLAIKSATHSQTWSHNFVPPYLFQVGDIGYVPPRPRGEVDEAGALEAYMGFERFVRICNMLDESQEEPEEAEEADFEVEEDAKGWATLHDFGRFERRDLQSFEAGFEGVLGWAVVTEPQQRVNVQIVHEESLSKINRAWEHLLAHGKEIAKKHGVRPEELMLVTRAGVDLRFTVVDPRTKPLQPHHPTAHAHAHRMHPSPFPAHHQPFGTAHRPGFPQHTPHMPPPFPAPPPLPSYLFTGPEEGFAVQLSDGPVYTPVGGAKRPGAKGRKRAVKKTEDTVRPPSRCLLGSDGVYGFMNYVRLHEEDFI